MEVEHPVGFVDEFAADCFGPMLAMGPAAASRRVGTCVMLASRLPMTLGAMGAGELDYWRAAVIAEELAEASETVCAVVEAQPFPAVLGESAGPVRRRARAVLARVDADAVRVRAARARLGRFVRAFPGRVPGLTEWVAALPAAESAACWAAIDELAHRVRADDPSRTLDQCRADALVDLGAPPACGGMLGNATVTATVTLTLPVETATGREPDGEQDERDVIVSAVNDGTFDASATTDDSEDEGSSRPAADNDPDGFAVVDDYPQDAAPEEDLTERSPVPVQDGPEGQDGDDRGEAAVSAALAGARAAAGAAAGAGRGYVDPLAETDDLGNPSGVGHPLVVPSWAKAGASGCEVPGIGIIPFDVVAAILARFETRVARVLLDPATGVVLETGAAGYRPNPGIRRLVHRRDRVCRFPGCAQPAHRCDLDHVLPWPTGPTAAWNLLTLCRHHHRVKHNAGWQLSMTREGVATWTDPHGRQYLTHPVDHHQAAA